MVVHFIRVPGIARHIRARHGSHRDGGTIRKDYPVPGHQHAFLPVDDSGIIDAEEFGPLRDKQLPPCGRVKDVLRNLRDDVARQVGIDARNHDTGDHRAGFQFQRLAGCAGMRQNPGGIFARPAEKGLFVLVGGWIVTVLPQGREIAPYVRIRAPALILLCRCSLLRGRP